MTSIKNIIDDIHKLTPQDILYKCSISATFKSYCDTIGWVRICRIKFPNENTDGNWEILFKSLAYPDNTITRIIIE